MSDIPIYRLTFLFSLFFLYLIDIHEDKLKIIFFRILLDKADLMDLTFLNVISNELKVEPNSNQYSNNSIYSFNDLSAYKNTWQMFLKLMDLKNEMEMSGGDLTELQKAHLAYELGKVRRHLFDAQNNWIKFCVGQKLEEVLCELERINCLCNYFRVKTKVNKSSFSLQELAIISSHLNQLDQRLVSRIEPFKEEIKNKVQFEFSALAKLVSFELSKEEKLMIVKAIGLKQGHWFKCPKGHIYCIG